MERFINTLYYIKNNIFYNYKADNNASWTNKNGNILAEYVKANRYEKVEYLLNKGVFVDYLDEYKFTPLMIAAREGNLTLAQLLLNYNASVNNIFNNSISALSLAIQKKNFDLVLLLIEKGADLNFKDINGDTPLMDAFLTFRSWTPGEPYIDDKLIFTKLLLSYNANIDNINNNGERAFDMLTDGDAGFNIIVGSPNRYVKDRSPIKT